MPATSRALPPHAGIGLVGSWPAKAARRGPGCRRHPTSRTGDGTVGHPRLQVIRNAADSAAGLARKAATLPTGSRSHTGTGLVVVRGTTGEQQTIVTTLGDAAADLKAAKLTGNGDVFIGEAVGSATNPGLVRAGRCSAGGGAGPTHRDQAASCRATAAVRRGARGSAHDQCRTAAHPSADGTCDRGDRIRRQWIAFTSVMQSVPSGERFEQQASTPTWPPGRRSRRRPRPPP